MSCEITAEGFFESGQCAPRGTYISLETGLVHRLNKLSRLPERGPFRMIAPSAEILPDRTPALPLRWPEEDQSSKAPVASDFNWSMLALFRMSRGGGAW